MHCSRVKRLTTMSIQEELIFQRGEYSYEEEIGDPINTGLVEALSTYHNRRTPNTTTDNETLKNHIKREIVQDNNTAPRYPFH